MTPLHSPWVSVELLLSIVMLLGSSCITTAHADPLGRLFFTPEQRNQLDREHARNAVADGRTSSVLTVNGIVQKQGGARTVWINGVPQSTANNSERSPTTQTVTVPGKSRPMKVKVGEIIPLDQPAPATPAAPGEPDAN